MTDRYLTFRTDAKGGTVIPAALRAQAGIREDGDVLVGHVEDGRLVIQTRAAVRRRLREQAAACRIKGVVDRLLADRQADPELREKCPQADPELREKGPPRGIGPDRAPSLLMPPRHAFAALAWLFGGRGERVVDACRSTPHLDREPGRGPGEVHRTAWRAAFPCSGWSLEL